MNFKIIETESELSEFRRSIRNRNIFLWYVPVSGKRHPCNDSISLLFIKLVSKNDVFCIPIDHSDTVAQFSLDNVCSMINTVSNKIFTVDKKSLAHLCNIQNSIDVQILGYLGSLYLKHPTITSSEQFYTFNYSSCSVINQLVPIGIHLKRFSEIYNQVTEFMDSEHSLLKTKSFWKLNNDIIDTLTKIENPGLFVDVDKFVDVFGEEHRKDVVDSRVFSQYNILTSTGRPSNKFGGVNYAALKKDDNTRLSFVSRHGSDGRLVEIDFTAFHPHLIAHLIRYDIPHDINIYEYLGSYYFKTKKLSTKLKKLAKDLTFKQLYGGVEHRYKEIPYFKKWDSYVTQRWDFFMNNAYIETPIFERMITLDHIGDDVNPNKIANYILQAYETEFALSIISSVISYLQNKVSDVILYTYDSILIDFHKDDGKDTLTEVQRIMMYNDKFPVKIKSGDNYKQLQKLNL